MLTQIQSTENLLSGRAAQPAFAFNERQWLAVYTAPRHEKQVSLQLEKRAIECFLPMCETLRRWKTGPTRVSLPLFPSYVFVHIEKSERKKVIELASVLNIVGNRLGPSAIPDMEIEALRQVVMSGRAEPHPYLNVGSRVRITHGPLAGTEGVLVRKKGQIKVVVSVELIMQSVAVEVDCCDVERCSNDRSSEPTGSPRPVAPDSGNCKWITSNAECSSEL